MVEAASGKRLADFLDERIFKPLKMQDAAFWVPAAKMGRVAQPLATDLASGQPIKVIDIAKEPKNDSGGAGAVSTAADYLRFSQMLLNGGELDGVRVLSPKSVALMTTNRLGPEVDTQGWRYYPGPGYGFGLGFAVRLDAGVAPQIGSVGDYFVEGLYSTFAFADPKEQLLAVFMIQSQEWRYYRPLVKALVLQSLMDKP